MSFYRLNGIKFDDLGKELQRFFVSNNIKTPIVSKGIMVNDAIIRTRRGVDTISFIFL
ncbi:hypothetical protein ES705_50968 [subsurface metagenome]